MFPGRIYVVEQGGIHDYDCGSLTQAMRYIGRKIQGRTFGCLEVTVKQAVEAGYQIRIV